MSGDGETGTSHPRARFESDVAPLVEALRRYLRRRTDAETAEDVLSETLLVCWRRLEELPGEPLPWAYGVARNCLANAERGVRRRARLAARLAATAPRTDAGGDDPVRADAIDVQTASIQEALAALPLADSEVLRLWAWEQLGPSEIAQVLAITPNAASIRLHRAKRKLRRALARLAAQQGRKDEHPAGHGQESGRSGP